jgi:hypothetical protein
MWISFFLSDLNGAREWLFSSYGDGMVNLSKAARCAPNGFNGIFCPSIKCGWMQPTGYRLFWMEKPSKLNSLSTRITKTWVLYTRGPGEAIEIGMHTDFFLGPAATSLPQVKGKALMISVRRLVSSMV